MKTRWIVALVIVLLALFAVRPRHRTIADTPEIPAAGTPALSSAAPTPAVTAPPAKATIPTDRVPAVSPAAPAPSATVPTVQPGGTLTELRDEVENVQFALRDYRSALGENPIGNNAEITKALTGDNLKQVKIPVPPGSTVNADGEMCDRWGTPYFFHQLSGRQMEVRSAGPDREMNTADDLVVK